MKKYIFILLSLALTFSAFAKKVKFAVDMTGQTVNATGVHVTGDFQTAAGFPNGDWQPGTTPLTREGTSEIYSTVVDIPANRKYEYRFLNGDQSYDTEFIPEESRVGYDFNDNRWIYIDSLANDTSFIGAILFSGNAPSGKLMLRFKVDMKNSLPVNAAGVHVAGSFQGWNAASTRLYSFADSVYEIIAFADAGSVEYKYYNGNTLASAEVVPSACATNGNRALTADKDSAFSTICFAACTVCSVTSGIGSLTASPDIRVFPNPFDQFTTVEFPSKGSYAVTLCDISGKVAYTGTSNGTALQISRSELKEGLYILFVNDGTATSRTKLIAR